MILRPTHGVRGELGAIVGNDHLRLAAHADNPPCGVCGFA
jgi:hypothetical protein